MLRNSLDLTKKKCHLWIHGPANSGKTYFVEQLIEKGIQVYQGPYNNDWFGFDQTVHEVVWFDEYRGQLTIQQLNALCDINTKLNVKGSSY